MFEKKLRLEDSSVEELSEKFEKTLKSIYLPSYHIYPKHGLLNDPNGLHYKDGYHHIYYQWHPNNPIHGIKYWYYVKTKDFINYDDEQIAIKPINTYDKHGVYSGSAYEKDNKVNIIYTGNDFDEEENRIATQLHGEIVDGEIINIKPLIHNEHYTGNFRDPKLFTYKNKDLIFIGAQERQSLLGCLSVYELIDNTNVKHLGKLDFKVLGSAYMFECPDIFELNKKVVCLFSPQDIGFEKENCFQNNDNVVYTISDELDTYNLSLINNTPIKEFDKGFDFYAPQTYLDNLGRRILIAWAGDGKSSYEKTKKDMWSEVLSMPRVLKVVDDYVCQYPIEELEELERECINSKDIIEEQIKNFKMTFNASEDFEIIIKSSIGEEIQFKRKKDQYIFTRLNQDISYKIDNIDKINRYTSVLEKNDDITIYVDNSIIEIFLNKNKETMTSRIFLNDIQNIEVSKNLKYKIRRMSHINLEYKKYDDKTNSKT